MLPLVLVGGAVVLGGLGGKKTVDAVGDYKQARSIATRAKERHDGAVAGAESVMAAATEAMALYGARRLSIYDQDLRSFVATLDALGAAQLSELAAIDVELADAIGALDLEDVNFDVIGTLAAGI